jgi:hypothetical protein
VTKNENDTVMTFIVGVDKTGALGIVTEIDDNLEAASGFEPLHRSQKPKNTK